MTLVYSFYECNFCKCRIGKRSGDGWKVKIEGPSASGYGPEWEWHVCKSCMVKETGVVDNEPPSLKKILSQFKFKR